MQISLQLQVPEKRISRQSSSMEHDGISNSCRHFYIIDRNSKTIFLIDYGGQISLMPASQSEKLKDHGKHYER